MSNDIQIPNKNIERNVVKKSGHSVTYKNGEKYYNFDSIKLIKKHISISEKSIHLLKNIIFYVLGGLTVILFYEQPHNINDVLCILNKIKENIFAIIYFITPYARCGKEHKWLYLINVGLIMSAITTILFFITNTDFSFIKKRKGIRIFSSIIFFFCLWYVLYMASFSIVKINKLFKFLSVIILFVISVFIFISIMCILARFDENSNSKN